MHRFTQLWNLLLDDYRLNLVQDARTLHLDLKRRTANAGMNRFGHALMLKLTHGIVSWLVGREVPVQEVVFAFARPPFASDYPILFPAPIAFGGKYSSIAFDTALGSVRPQHSMADVRIFLERAPRDWIFTFYREHALRLKVRELLYADLRRTLEEVSRKLHMSSRTLIRKL